MNPGGPAWLFVPANRPDRVLRAAALADVVVIDCEDAVAVGDREVARSALVGLTGRLDPTRTVVRINALGTEDAARDLQAVAQVGLTTVMVPKAEDPASLAALAPLSVVALCETPAGVLAAPALASVPTVVGLMWGSVDLAAALGAAPWTWQGGTRQLPGVLDQARWQVLLAARAGGVVAIDHADVELTDLAGVAADAGVAARSGYDAKACIHPRQVAVVRDAFAPSAEQLAWARSVLAAGEGGALRDGGRLVDEAVRQQARRLLQRDVNPG